MARSKQRSEKAPHSPPDANASLTHGRTSPSGQPDLSSVYEAESTNALTIAIQRLIPTKHQKLKVANSNPRPRYIEQLKIIGIPQSSWEEAVEEYSIAYMMEQRWIHRGIQHELVDSYHKGLVRTWRNEHDSRPGDRNDEAGNKVKGLETYRESRKGAKQVCLFGGEMKVEGLPEGELHYLADNAIDDEKLQIGWHPFYKEMLDDR